MKPLQGIVCFLCLMLISVLTCQGYASDQNADPNQKAFDMATEELVCFNFQVGYQMFGELVQTLPKDHPLYFKSVYARATCAQHITPPTYTMINEASGLYSKIVEECKDKQLVGRSLINLGRIAELRDYAGDEINLDEARKYYQKVVDANPDSELADEATLWIAGTYIQVVNDNPGALKGVAMLEQWLAKRPGNVYASPMWTYLGTTYEMTLNEPVKALACFIKADEIGLPAESQISSYYWRMALLAEKVPNALDTAVTYYQKIIKITPTSGRAFEAKLALERLSKAHPEMKIHVPEIKLYQIGE